MSQWTHIRGCFELESSALEFKKIKIEKPADLQFKDELTEEEEKRWDTWVKAYERSAYYPYPKEQIRLTAPETRPLPFHKDDEEKAFVGLRVSMYAYSLPRARPYIEKAFELLPQGESGINYSLSQNDSQGSSSSSWFHFNCEEKAFADAIEEMYKHQVYGSWKYKELKKYI